jgi:hypothetical protein
MPVIPAFEKQVETGDCEFEADHLGLQSKILFENKQKLNT